MTDYKKIIHCRLCKSSKIAKVFDLKKTPLANGLIRKVDFKKKQKFYPLALSFCKSCGHTQLSHAVSPNKMFDNYLYLSNTSKQSRDHFKSYANEVTKKFFNKRKINVIDIASNDGTFLNFFNKKKFNRIGIDPAKNLLKFSEKKGIKQIPMYFTNKNSLKIKKNFGKFEVVTANHVCAHVLNLHDFFSGVANILKNNGVFIFEVSYLADVIKKKTFDTIYHEHMDYHALMPLINFVKKFGLEIFDFQLKKYQGGSIRIYVSKKNSRKINQQKILRQINIEKNKLKLFKAKTYIKFANEVNNIGIKLKNLLNKLKKNNKSILGYGAAAKTTTLTSFFKISKKELDFIVDDNNLKQNLYTPNYRIPIKHPKEMYKKKPDYIIILAWNYADHILTKHRKNMRKYSKFIIPFPKIKII